MTAEPPSNDAVPSEPAPDSGADPFTGPDWRGAGSVGPVVKGERTPGATRVKVSRRKKRTLRRRRLIGIGMLVLGGLIVLAAVYIVVTGLLARRELTQVRAEVHRLRADISAGQLPAARAEAARLAQHAHRADQYTSGPIWALAAGIPSGGEPLQTIRGVTAALDSLGTKALPALVDASQQIDPTKLRRADGSIDLAPISAVAPELARASNAVTAATSSVAGLPASTWLSTIDSARSDVLSQLTSLGGTVRGADLAARVAPTMLGQDGPRTYLIAFETEAELRGTGGLPGAFAILRADHGKLKFVRFENDSTLVGTKSGLDFGAAYNALYNGSSATTDYLDSNVSPHFPYAAQIWTAMWRKHSGEQLDGALALDPTALSYLLRVTGPTTLPDGTVVSADNVVQLTQQTVYSKFPTNDQAGRKQFQLSIARAVSSHLLGAAGNTTALVKAAGQAAGQRRLMAWSTDPTIEKYLTQTPLGGAVQRTAAPYIGLAVNNAAANKLDYYLDASLVWKRTGCGSTRDVTVTMTLRNDAPANLPGYVLGFTGRRGFPQNPGDNRLLFDYFATRGARIGAVTLDGKQSTRGVYTEQGHPVFHFDLHLPRGSTSTLVFHLVEPAGSGAPVVMPQPLVRPLKITVDDARCG